MVSKKSTSLAKAYKKSWRWDTSNGFRNEKKAFIPEVYAGAKRKKKNIVRVENNRQP